MALESPAEMEDPGPDSRGAGGRAARLNSTYAATPRPARGTGLFSYITTPIQAAMKTVGCSSLLLPRSPAPFLFVKAKPVVKLPVVLLCALTAQVRKVVSGESSRASTGSGGECGWLLLASASASASKAEAVLTAHNVDPRGCRLLTCCCYGYTLTYHIAG